MPLFKTIIIFDFRKTKFYSPPNLFYLIIYLILTKVHVSRLDIRRILPLSISILFYS